MEIADDAGTRQQELSELENEAHMPLEQLLASYGFVVDAPSPGSRSTGGPQRAESPTPAESPAADPVPQRRALAERNLRKVVGDGGEVAERDLAVLASSSSDDEAGGVPVGERCGVPWVYWGLLL